MSPFLENTISYNEFYDISLFRQNYLKMKHHVFTSLSYSHFIQFPMASVWQQ